MDNCVLKPVWSTLKPVILAKFLTGANRQRRETPGVCRRAPLKREPTVQTDTGGTNKGYGGRS
jgi:hypothetical protein